MECENVFCVYQNEGKCILEEISIDISGRCSGMIYVEVDDKSLKREKNKILERYAKD